MKFFLLFFSLIFFSFSAFCKNYQLAELIELAKQNSVNIKVAHISALAQKKCHKIFTKIIEIRWYVLIFFGLVSLFGCYSLSKIKIDAIPDINNKQVIVNIKTFGMDPTKIEKSVTYPIEAELYGVSGPIEMRSISKFGLSQITLIFADGLLGMELVQKCNSQSQSRLLVA